MKPRATVVIPNWNGRRFLGICLSSLRKQTFQDFEAVVVDNGSTDGSAEYIEENFPEAGVVALDENRGFAAAANAGIQASGAEFVVLLNNDTEQNPLWLESLITAADAHPEAGFFASKLLDFEDRTILDGAADAIHWSGLTLRIGHGERDLGQYDEQKPVFGACGAAAMYRRAMLGDIGLFDEDFISYCEDGDLSFRAQLMGYDCIYAPSAVVYHMGSATSGGKGSPLSMRLGTRNSVWLAVKNLPAPLLPKRLPLAVAGQSLRIALTSSSPELFKAHIAGLAQAARHLPAMLGKRRKIQARRRVPAHYIESLLKGSSVAVNDRSKRRLKARLKNLLGAILRR